MGLRIKFNLAVLAAFRIGFGGAGFFLQRLFIDNARREVLQNARIMMSSAEAILHFTDTYVTPLAEPQNGTGPKFVAAPIPFFPAQTTFKDVQARYPDYTYREPTLNPTDLIDRPSDWEADEINAFRNQPGLAELTAAEMLTHVRLRLDAVHDALQEQAAALTQGSVIASTIVRMGRIVSGDRFLLCSDRIARCLNPPDLAKSLLNGAPAEKLSLQLGAADNISAVVIDFADRG